MKAFLLVLWTLAAASGAQGVNPLVQTESGDVMGRNVQVGGECLEPLARPGFDRVKCSMQLQPTPTV